MSLSIVGSDEEAEEETRLRSLVKRVPKGLAGTFGVDGKSHSLETLRQCVTRISFEEKRTIILVKGGTGGTSKEHGRVPRALVFSSLGVVDVTWHQDDESKDGHWLVKPRGVWKRSLFSILGCPSVYLCSQKTNHVISVFPRSHPVTSFTVTWSVLTEAHSPIYGKSQLLDLMAAFWSHSSHVYFARLKNGNFSVVKMNQRAEFQCLRCEDSTSYGV